MPTIEGKPILGYHILEKKSTLVTRAFSAKSYTHDTDRLHSCTRLRLVQEMACLSVSLVQDLAEKALVPKLDSYSPFSRKWGDPTKQYCK